MIEAPRGVDLWEIACDAHVITTNGDVNRDGLAVMGRGCALEAARYFPDLPRRLALSLRQNGGNHVHVHPMDRTPSPRLPHVRFVVTFPVKHHWNEDADLTLIQRSARELVRAADEWEFESLVMPRPGCGNGRLRWEDVEPITASILDDRFVLVHK